MPAYRVIDRSADQNKWTERKGNTLRRVIDFARRILDVEAHNSCRHEHFLPEARQRQNGFYTQQVNFLFERLCKSTAQGHRSMPGISINEQEPVSRGLLSAAVQSIGLPRPAWWKLMQTKELQ